MAHKRKDFNRIRRRRVLEKVQLRIRQYAWVKERPDRVAKATPEELAVATHYFQDAHRVRATLLRSF